MKRFYHSKLLTLALVLALSASTAAASLSPAYASPRDHTSLIQENLESINRLLQESASVAGINGSEAYIAEGIDTTSAEEVDVIVQFTGPPVAMGMYAARLGFTAMAEGASEFAVQSEQDAFTSQAQTHNISFTINRTFNTVLNGMEITIPANQLPQLAKLPNVKSIYNNTMYYPIEESDSYQPAGGPEDFDKVPLEQMGVLDAWERGYTGEGLKVGVLDTGVDYLHPDIANAYVEGYDAVNLDDDPYEDYPIFDYEGSHHGTHVSGTIVGTASNPTSDHVQKGVAYNAKLYAYKVLGPEGGTSAQVIDGIEHAVEDGMDVINLSLGSDLEKDPDSPDATAVNNAVLAGVVAVVANGNAGAGNHYYYSMGSPASAQLAISVGAATSDGYRYSGTLNSTVASAVYGERLNLMSWTMGQENFGEIFGTEPIQGVYVGLGAKSDYEGYDSEFLSDKIVFISRGSITFDEKVKNAAKHGAKAAIIFNGNTVSAEFNEIDLSDDIPSRNGPIGPGGFLGEGYDYIPTFDMPGKMGRALARELLANPEATLQFSMMNDFAYTLVPGDRMADFSSRGPNSDGNFGIKPDLSAPGVQIFSTVPAFGSGDYDKAYARLSGTSMASPHVAGLALLIKQAHPEWTPTDIRAALANTADSIHDENGTLYDVYSQGAGRVNVIRAIETPAIIQSMDELTIYDDQMNPTVIPSEGSSVSFGIIDPNAEQPAHKPLRVKNLSDAVVAYNVSIVMHPSVTSDPRDPIATPDTDHIEVGLEGVDGNQIAVGAGGSFDFGLTATAKANAIDGVYEGEVLLESEGLPSLHLPFVIHVGENSDNNGFPIQNLEISNTVVAKETPIDITASLPTGELNHLYAVIYSMQGEVLGLAAEFYDRDEDTDTLKPLPENIIIPEFDGSINEGIYLNDGNKANFYLPEGRYKIIMIGSVYDEEYNLVDQALAFKTFYMSGDSGVIDPDPTPPPTPPITPPVVLPGPVKPTYHAEVADSVLEKGQIRIPVKEQSNLEGTTLLVSVTDADWQAAITDSKQPLVALHVGAASEESSSAELKLTAAQVKMIREAGIKGTLVFSWNDASVAIPLPALEQATGSSDVVIAISKDEGSQAEFVKQTKDAAIIGTPYEFKASIVSADGSAPLKLKADEVVTRSFGIEKGIDVSSAGALYLDGGKVYPVPGKITKIKDGGSILTVRRPGFSTYAAASRQVSFTDIGKSWAKDQIQSLGDKFLLNGTSEHAYSPKDPVTRAQFAAMLVRAVGLQGQAASIPFADVTPSDWYASDVTAAYKAGLVHGYDGLFKPNAVITRQDMAVMLARAIKLIGLQVPDPTSPHVYADSAKFGAYAQESIRIATDAGLVQGTLTQGSYYFQPADTTTREASAKVLYQLLQVSGRIN